MRILHYIAYQIAILRNSAENLKIISLILYEHCVNNTNCSNVFICGIVIRTCPLSCMSVALFTQEHYQKSILIMPHSFLISHMGVGYGRQVYGLVWWIWYGLYACVKMLYYVVCATIALSWLDSAVYCFCAGLVCRIPKTACRGIWCVFYSVRLCDSIILLICC